MVLLERRFQKVIVEPTSINETIEILNNIKIKYEEHHNVVYTDEALRIVCHSFRKIYEDRYLPDKAIDALDEAGSRVHITNIETPEHIIKMEEKIASSSEKKKP